MFRISYIEISGSVLGVIKAGSLPAGMELDTFNSVVIEQLKSVGYPINEVEKKILYRMKEPLYYVFGIKNKKYTICSVFRLEYNETNQFSISRRGILSIPFRSLDFMTYETLMVE